MAKTLYERRAEIQEKIRQLENQRKQLIQKQNEADRKSRTRRLIERGAILESMIDGADTLTNEGVRNVLIAALKSRTAIDALVAIQKR